jgi:hypothetical protein
LISAIRDQLSHRIQILPRAATCTQLQTWACIRMRGLESDYSDSAQHPKVPL